MSLTRFPSFSLRDPAYLQGAGGSTPVPILGTTSWFNADQSITEQQFIGNLMEAPGDRADALHTNLVPLQPNAILCPRNSDNLVNFAFLSEDISQLPWQPWLGASIVGGNLRFSAATQYLRQRCYYCQENISYTIKVKLRRVSGDVEVAIRHSGTGVSAQATNVSITGVLTQFTVTFTGPTDGNFCYIGINHVSGTGDVEVTEYQVRKTADDDGYLATTNTPRVGAIAGVKTWGTSYAIDSFDTANTYGIWEQAVDFPVIAASVATFYASVYIRAFVNSGTGIVGDSITQNPILGHELAAPRRMRMWSYDVGPAYVYGPNVSLGWNILTWVINGAASEMRVNKGAATVVNADATCTPEKLRLGGTAPFYTQDDYHEFIFRKATDNTALQDAIIEYMAAQVGLVV